MHDTITSDCFFAPFRRYLFVGLIILTIIGAGRIISTYQVFSRTSDEGAHIAAGLEWLDHGTYTYEYHHPPLARVAMAFWPYLTGSRSTGHPNLVAEGDAIIYRDGLPSRALWFARFGVLPFFIITVILVWVWSRQLFGAYTALAATVFLTTLPPILAHSGFATTDMPFTALFTASVYTFSQWLEKGGRVWSAILGVVVGLTILSKFSVFLFLPMCGIAIVAVRWGLSRRVLPGRQGRFGRFAVSLLIAGLTLFLVLWSGYRFNMSSPNALAHQEKQTLLPIDQLLEPGSMQAALYQRIEHIRFPLAEIVYGMFSVLQHNRMGHDSYLLEEIRTHGWWYFFPVALAVKTPLPFLFFALLGFMLVLRQTWQKRDWQLATPAVCAPTILLIVLPSTINIGLRHILAIYPFLSILAGVGLVALLRQTHRRRFGLALALLLLSWHIISGMIAHPDYLAYFNELAGDHPERFLINSDLDWGQDAYRLRETLQDMDIDSVFVAVRYHRSRNLFRVHHHPDVHTLRPGQPVTGWVAISAGTLYRTPGYEWLYAYTPVRQVGASIYLYHIQNN